MLRILAILALGTALGVGTVAAAVLRLGGVGVVRIGPWQSPLDAGGIDRGPYLRAVAAVRATLALSRQEAIYFRAATDSSGQTLHGTCTYTVHGPDLPARWWSITLYGADHYLIVNQENRYAVASVNAVRTQDGGFSITISPKPHQGDWLDTAGTPEIVLLTRLYQPAAAAAAAPAAIIMPRIDLVACA
jgi:hypothetical protein